MFRPIPEVTTYAAGVPQEGWVESRLDRTHQNPRGFLTSNGGISKFIERFFARFGEITLRLIFYVSA